MDEQQRQHYTLYPSSTEENPAEVGMVLFWIALFAGICFGVSALFPNTSGDLRVVLVIAACVGGYWAMRGLAFVLNHAARALVRVLARFAFPLIALSVIACLIVLLVKL